MRLFDGLSEDHRLITGCLGAFERYLAALERGEDHNQQDLHRFVTFLVDYAEAWHHRKEEDVLFVALARHGWSHSRGPLAFVRTQHVHERELFGQLRQSAMARDLWSKETLASFTARVRELIRFEREHMTKENEVLYPEAQRDLSQEIPDQLNAELDNFESTHHEHGYIDWLRELGQELSASYPAP